MVITAPPQTAKHYKQRIKHDPLLPGFLKRVSITLSTLMYKLSIEGLDVARAHKTKSVRDDAS